MKLYVCSNSEYGTESIDGIYYLITEEGERLASHRCSSKWFAKGDLYERRPERIKKYTDRFGECECLYLGEDDMTFSRLIELNIELGQKEVEDKCSISIEFTE